MKIILSPAKTMVRADDDFAFRGLPELLDRTEVLLADLKQLSAAELKKVFRSSEKIAEENYVRYQNMDLRSGLSPALFSYTGLAYKHLAPAALTDEGLAYLQEHLRIVSGFYGLLRPFDGIVPYRLEMQSLLPGRGSLYTFWSDSIYHALQDDLIVNLASAEYADAVSPYLREDDRMITVVFAERKNGKLIQKGTYAKMLRGEMVYWMAEHRIEDVSRLKEFDIGVRYSEADSDPEHMVFIRSEEGK